MFVKTKCPCGWSFRHDEDDPSIRCPVCYNLAFGDDIKNDDDDDYKDLTEIFKKGRR